MITDQYYYVNTYAYKSLNKIERHYKMHNLVNDIECGELTKEQTNLCLQLLEKCLDFENLFKTLDVDCEMVVKDTEILEKVKRLVMAAINNPKNGEDIFIDQRVKVISLRYKEWLERVMNIKLNLVDAKSIDDEVSSFEPYVISLVDTSFYNSAYGELKLLLSYELNYNIAKKENADMKQFRKLRNDLKILLNKYNEYEGRDITKVDDFKNYESKVKVK